MRYFIHILIFLWSISYVSAQNLTGRVTDTSNNPVYGAVIYIPEQKQGLVTNQEGLFQINLKEGKYTFRCKHPDYKEQEVFLDVLPENNSPLEITLEKNTFYTYEHHGRRDTLARHIIKNSITQSPVYFNSVQQYKANSYMNGKLVLENIPEIIDRASYRLDSFHISELKDKIITQEIYNEIEYFYPNIYKVKIDGSSGHIPDRFTQKGATNILRTSIYSDRIGYFISPLNNNAFHFYRYRYEGYCISQEGTKVHKIRVRSRLKDPELLNGHLYIVDGTWTVLYAILDNNKSHITTTTTIVYDQVQDNIYLPIAYYSNTDFNILNTVGNLRYHTALQYDTISITPYSFKKGEPVTTETTIDPYAFERDEAYWSNFRLQPLEIDSVKMISDTLHFNKEKLSPTQFWIGRALLGDYMIGNDSSSFSAKYNGVKFVFRDYNYVDGFWLGNKFDLKIKINDKSNIEAYPYIYYLTARKRLLAGSNIIYNYSPKRLGQLTLSMDTRTEDYNNLSLTRYQNYFSSLFLGKNYNFFYQRDHITISNDIHLNRKVKLSTTFGVEKRHGLSNHTEYNVLDRDHIKPNIYPDDRFDRTYYSIKFFYSPRSNYSITEALDMHEKGVTPVFNIEYQHSFSSWQTNNSKYQKLKGGVSHSIRLDYFNYIDYKIESGVFLNTGRKMHFADYQHFGASDLLLNLNSLFDSFLLLDNYDLQTNRYWVNVFLNYSGKYVALKYIPFLQGKPFTENLHLKTLFTPDMKSYIETGYSISFNRYFGLGSFVSFHNAQGRKFGVTLSVNLRSLSFIQ